jgi:hypothetical protein
MENRRIERLTISTTCPDDAHIMSIILTLDHFAVLSHLVLDFDLEHTIFPLGPNNDRRAVEPSPTLGRVDLVFRSCPPRLIQDQDMKNSYRQGMSFLRKCEERGIAVHTMFLEKGG